MAVGLKICLLMASVMVACRMSANGQQITTELRQQGYDIFVGRKVIGWVGKLFVKTDSVSAIKCAAMCLQAVNCTGFQFNLVKSTNCQLLFYPWMDAAYSLSNENFTMAVARTKFGRDLGCFSFNVQGDVELLPGFSKPLRNVTSARGCQALCRKYQSCTYFWWSNCYAIIFPANSCLLLTQMTITGNGTNNVFGPKSCSP